MSKITDITDAILARMGTTYPTHKELCDPVIIEANDTLFLNMGYGVALGVGLNSEKQLSCRLSVQRDFIITLTRCMPGTYRDPSAKTETYKLLLEDQLLLINELEKDPDIEQDVASFKYISDNGIEPVFNERESFLMVQSTFQAEYFETLS